MNALISRLAPLLLVASLFVACSDDKANTVATPEEPEVPELSEDAVPDFSAPDVNSTSATNGQTISPRDHLQSVSVWYFGRST